MMNDGARNPVGLRRKNLISEEGGQQWRYNQGALNLTGFCTELLPEIETWCS